MAMVNERGNSRRTQFIAATGQEGRGEGDGNETAAQRVADLMSADEHGKSGVFAKKELAAKKAREQWWPESWNPKNPGYVDASAVVTHTMPQGQGHGPVVPPPPSWAADGWVSHPDPNRLPEASEDEGEARALQGATIQVGMGMGAFSKDWRSEASRIGRYWQNPEFALQPNGTWTMKGKRQADLGASPPSGGNPFEVRR